MRISARCDYACKALLELSLHWPKKTPIHIQYISEKQRIPMRFLTQILIQLKRSQFVESIRGNQGGYLLAKSPNHITLGMVIREIDGSLLPVMNSSGGDGIVFSSIWEDVGKKLDEILDRITFEDICDRLKEANSTLTYQI